MGGWGSGVSRGYSTTDGRRKLRISGLRKAGLLVTGKSWGWQWSRGEGQVSSIQGSTEADKIILSYSQRIEGGGWKPVRLPVRLEWTACNYGGHRAWFRCPAAGCGRRVAVLYCGTIFACRHCLQLAYQSQREDSASLMMRKADKIRDRLGWVPGIANGSGQKPKGMYWQTYWRLCSEESRLADVALSMKMQKFIL